jgi:2-oxoisovalerate dehydrogenase E2 component (dihydrolipoyl transacylase)
VAIPVMMPRLGESVTEGTITRWLKAEGEEVERDEPLCEVDTDKVNTELPSPVAGRVEKLLISEGTTVDVGTEIALVAGAQESGSPDEALFRKEWPVAGTEAQPVVDDGPKRRAVAEARSEEAWSTESDGRGQAESAQTLRLRRSSPAVRRLAEEHGIDISEISGTGTGGRVTKKDIESYIKERKSAPEVPPISPEPARERMPVYGGDRVVELTGIRRATAERMAVSKREVPHTWTMVEADVTGLVALRESAKEEFVQQEGVKLTYLPFIVQAVIESLKEHPVLNSVWDGDRIVLRKRINVGVAVDLESALIVPVIHDADGLNFLGLVRAIDDRVRRAREGRLTPDDITGGTFTISNPGALGSVASTPIINHPQAAILSSEAIVKRPVVVGDDAMAIRSMLNLEVSFDHRIVDGGPVLRFLRAVKRHLEDIGPNTSLVR